MSSAASTVADERVTTLEEDREQDHWNLEGYCRDHELTKSFLRTQLRHLERTYQERIQELNTHEAPYEDQRRHVIAERKWDKKTARPKWYICWEMLYILWLWFSITVSIIYFGTAFTIQPWITSIRSIAVGETSFVPAAAQGIQFVSPIRFYDMVEGMGYHGRSTATYYIVVATYLFFFSCTTIVHAGWEADGRSILYGLLHQGIIFSIELYTVDQAYKTLPTKICRPEVFRQSLLNRYFKWYGILALHKDSRGEEALDKIHQMQGAIGCCGIDGYMDYYNIFATQSDPGFNASWWPDNIGVRRLFERFDKEYYLKNGRDVRQVPFSCCKPIWRNDMYCADNIFYFDNNILNGTGISLAKERLNPRGCVEVVYETCNYFRMLLTDGMWNFLIFRSILFLLLIIFSPIIHKSLRWRMKWLWFITEGQDGLRYLPFVTKKKDIMFLALRQPHDRFDPKLFRWKDPDFINLEVPRDGVPLPYLVKLDDLPSEAEFGRLREVASSANPTKLAEDFAQDEKFFTTKPTDSYRALRGAKLRHSAESAELAKQMAQSVTEKGEISSGDRGAYPGEVVTPEFRFYPTRKTIHFKEKKKYTTPVPHQPIPPDATDWDRKTLEHQATVHIDTRFDWAGAIEQVRQDEADHLIKLEKAKEQRVIRNARIKGFDTSKPWLPAKKDIPLLHKRFIAADEDDEAPPMWDPRDPKEGSGGFLQPTQQYEIAREKAYETGQKLPAPPTFSHRSKTEVTVPSNHLADWMWESFPEMAEKASTDQRFHEPKKPAINMARKSSRDKPGQRMLNVLGATNEKEKHDKHARLVAKRRSALRQSKSALLDEIEKRVEDAMHKRKALDDAVAQKREPPVSDLAKKWTEKGHKSPGSVDQSGIPNQAESLEQVLAPPALRLRKISGAENIPASGTQPEAIPGQKWRKLKTNKTAGKRQKEIAVDREPSLSEASLAQAQDLKLKKLSPSKKVPLRRSVHSIVEPKQPKTAGRRSKKSAVGKTLEKSPHEGKPIRKHPKGRVGGAKTIVEHEVAIQVPSVATRQPKERIGAKITIKQIEKKPKKESDRIAESSDDKQHPRQKRKKSKNKVRKQMKTRVEGGDETFQRQLILSAEDPPTTPTTAKPKKRKKTKDGKTTKKLKPTKVNEFAKLSDARGPVQRPIAGKKGIVRVNVRPRRSVHSIVDPRQGQTTAKISSRNVPGTGENVKHDLRKLGRVKINRKPIPIEERMPWRP